MNLHVRFFQSISTKTVFVLGLTLLSFQGAKAEDKGLGCGLGSMIAPKKSWMSATTQSVIDYTANPSFSVTSGTSGCAKHSIVKKDREAVYFAEANYAKLEIEIPRGQGEYLANFTKVLGCQPSSQAAVAQSMKNHYQQLFPADQSSADQMLRNVQTLIKSEPQLKTACSADFII